MLTHSSKGLKGCDIHDQWKWLTYPMMWAEQSLNSSILTQGHSHVDGSSDGRHTGGIVRDP